MIMFGYENYSSDKNTESRFQSKGLGSLGLVFGFRLCVFSGVTEYNW